MVKRPLFDQYPTTASGKGRTHEPRWLTSSPIYQLVRATAAMIGRPAHVDEQGVIRVSPTIPTEYANSWRLLHRPAAEHAGRRLIWC